MQQYCYGYIMTEVLSQALSGYKAKKGCHPDNQSSLLTLKSNTMKNTVQR